MIGRMVVSYTVRCGPGIMASLVIKTHHGRWSASTIPYRTKYNASQGSSKKRKKFVLGVEFRLLSSKDVELSKME